MDATQRLILGSFSGVALLAGIGVRTVSSIPPVWRIVLLVVAVVVAVVLAVLAYKSPPPDPPSTRRKARMGDIRVPQRLPYREEPPEGRRTP